ncbi:MAG: glycoside hydrolase N-terminal domain-containing protein, partial [Clostridia bacterium]|nr:glycoside hydrolase N-terminal domain-containing protein [Clostridia bacterium]
MIYQLTKGMADCIILLYRINGDDSMKNNELMFYNSPAKAWTQALPIGNGSLGAMIY